MRARLRALVTGSLRYKLLTMVLLPVLLLAPLTLVFAVRWSWSFNFDQLLRQARKELTVSRHAFQRTELDYVAVLQSLAASHPFQIALEESDEIRLRNQIEVVRRTTGFDFLHLTDLKGRWLLAAELDSREPNKPSVLLQRAVERGTPQTGIEIYAPEDLVREGEVLAVRAAIPLVDAAPANAHSARVEPRGMVIRAVHPVRDLSGKIVALLDGGVLVNRNVGLVDSIRDLVYGPGTLPPDSFGTVTVHLGDVRVSTNLPAGEDRRALGTRAPARVTASVLGGGRAWAGRSLMLDEWFVSAYEPLIDVYGRRVGMLSTGFLERPFRAAYYRTIGVLIGMVAIGVAIAAWLALLGARSIFRPIERAAAVIRETRRGGASRIGPVGSEDEIGALAREFDAMLDLLEERNRAIRAAADELETKVEERTRELSEKNARLQETIDLLRETKHQLEVAEKLAALGELTAGVAHEINNPIAVIQGNVEILREELGEAAEPVAVEIGLVLDQIERIRSIVDKLLRYSRPSSFGGNVEQVDLRSAVEDTLVLVKHELGSRRVRVERYYAETRSVAVDRQELQQVLVNLLINAAQAVEPGDTVRVTTADWEGGGEGRGVRIEVHDDGVGIDEAHQDRVFDPFFTTKRTGGTGLGLSVSYGIVRRYGGVMSFTSRAGKGTTFRVCLPSRPDHRSAREQRSPDGCLDLSA